MKPEPTPRDGTARGWMLNCPFGMPKRFRNSFSGLSSSSWSRPIVFVVPTTLMLTTAGPSRSTSDVKSGRRAAAVEATGDVTAGAVAALASDSADVSRWLYPAPTARPKPAAASATVSCFRWYFIDELLRERGGPARGGGHGPIYGRSLKRSLRESSPARRGRC